MTHNPGMGLLHRIFGTARDKDASDGSAPASSQFHESETTSEADGSRNAPRRELVQVILRDTMRKHGIPSDWVDVRILSTLSRSGRPGLHVCFVVKKAHDRLLNYVLPFQDSFNTELAQFEPRAAEWLLSVAWQFEDYPAEAARTPGQADAAGSAGLARSAGSAGTAGSAGSAAAPADPAAPLEFPRRPVPVTATAAVAAVATVAPPPQPQDEDVQRDLEALFAIRDQALAEAAVRRAAAAASDEEGGNGFEPTRPGFEDSGDPQQRRT